MIFFYLCRTDHEMIQSEVSDVKWCEQVRAFKQKHKGWSHRIESEILHGDIGIFEGDR
jgi:hypothetical protein